MRPRPRRTTLTRTRMSLELYLGPMFAGKSSAILGIIRRNEVIKRATLCLTSALDKRYTTEARIVSHNKESYPAVAVSELTPLLETPDFAAAKCIIIEEAQFFPDLRIFTLEAVETYGKHVICVGLDGDSERRPFGQLLELIPYSDKVQKFTALCTRCGDGTEAIFTYRKAGSPGAQIAVGGQDTYQPVCRRHYLAEKECEAAAAAAAAAAAVTLLTQNRTISTFGAASGGSTCG